MDPKRDVDDYLADAELAGLRVVAVPNTHPHADFASGFAELTRRTDAHVYASHRAPLTYPRLAAKMGDRLRLGRLEVEILETPGYSPNSLSFLVRKDGCPAVLFSGDLLFVGDVGRPDLRDAEEGPEAVAHRLYDSRYSKCWPCLTT